MVLSLHAGGGDALAVGRKEGGEARERGWRWAEVGGDGDGVRKRVRLGLGGEVEEQRCEGEWLGRR